MRGANANATVRTFGSLTDWAVARPHLGEGGEMTRAFWAGRVITLSCIVAELGAYASQAGVEDFTRDVHTM